MNNINKPQCFNAFYSSKKNFEAKVQEKETPLKIKAAVMASSALCAYGATYLVARKQSKALKQLVNIFNVKFNELNMLGIACAALTGGLLTGMVLDEPKYRKAKIKEGIHQAIANIICPFALVGLLNKGYEKISKNIKLPQLKNNSKFNNFINTSIKIAPNLAITLISLVAGVIFGTKIANKINEDASDEFTPRKIKTMDFMYHPDDVAAAFVLADKNGYIQKTVGKIIPPVFMMHGYEAGTKRNNN